ncbi:hypothetical protein [Helicobacter sp. MIT 14-3879]|uniref:hypothetical protein n=1 Tax=Helicobacter sp. MIT 14-3879 TaxID=2040649 RepID=UPI000E1FB500|nr:hypothetical protein [Helicobacter sp. MIT 14-3879]RDU60078.1 hypothetical protein CQA44_10880 [Helicobacter sp. MIT 14-3879]
MALFNDVEPNAIFRHLVWSVLFIASTAYYINTYILPHANQYKEQLHFNRITQSTLQQTRVINENARNTVNAFSSSNNQKLQVFSGSLNENAMRKIIQQGFLKINVRKIGEKNIPQDQLKQIQYSVSGEVATNNLFLILQIIPRLHEKYISAILDLPLSLKKNARGNIDFSLGFSIMQSTYSHKL